MSKTEFLANEQKYITSVSITAGVARTNVKILNVKEISTRRMALRLLLTPSVQVQTSVLLAYGQQTLIQDQSVLNANLISNGLPNCTLVVQNMTLFLVGGVTPSPGSDSNGSGSFSIQTPTPSGSGSSTASSVPIGKVVGCVAGFCALLVGGLTCYRYYYSKSDRPQIESSSSVIRPTQSMGANAGRVVPSNSDELDDLTGPLPMI